MLLFLLLLSPPILTPTTADCPYDMKYATSIIPPECYANETSRTPFPPLKTTTASCCWFVFASYLYIAIRYSNLTGTAFLPNPIATTCTSAFTAYLIREGLVPTSLLLSGQRCNFSGDPLKFVSGPGPCEYSNISAIIYDANFTLAREVCDGGSDRFNLTVNQTACAKCQDVVTKVVLSLLRVRRSKKIVACGLAATMGLWALDVPGPLRFRSFALCMVQVLGNVGSLGSDNLFPSDCYPPESSSSVDDGGGHGFSPFSASTKAKIILATLVSVATVLLLFSTGLFFVYAAGKRKQMWRTSDIDVDDATTGVIGPPLPTEGLYIFTKSELKQATNNYDPKLLLGEGGAGKVYLGRLPSGQHVAIKRISKMKKLGEFYSEVEILAKLRHRSLATLVGYCLERKEKEHVLVYEYMPGGNLCNALYQGSIPWQCRVKIAVDIAEGLVHLHEFHDGAVIHRDVKPSNILLTESGKAKLSDFGVSRIVPVDTSHVSTEVKGTRGYVDPEYFSAGQVSESTDVYSYGIVLLELVTGLQAVVPTASGGAESIVQRAHAVITAAAEGEVDVAKVIDERLGVDWDTATATKVFKLAYWCVKPYKNERPRMTEVLAVLKRVLTELDGTAVDVDVDLDGRDEESVDVERDQPSW